MTHLRALVNEASALDWYPFEGDEADTVLLSDRIVTARKGHTCQHCNGPIYAGERHRAYSEVDRGARKRMTFRYCPDCLNAYELNSDGCGTRGLSLFDLRSQLYPGRAS